MMHWFQGIVILHFVSFSAWAGNSELNYSIKDLEILEKQENFDEFFNHAKDIRPSERGPIWQAMVVNMSHGLILSKTAKRDFKQSTLAQIEALSDWPEIKQSEIFAVKRSDYLVNYFQACVKEHYPYCQSELEKAWKKSDLAIPAYAELGLSFSDLLLKMASNNGDEDQDRDQVNMKASALKKNEAVGLTPYSYELFRLSFSDRFGSIYCKRENVQNAAMHHLVGLGAKYFDAPEARIKLTRLISDNCLAAMSDYLHHKLFSSEKLARETAYVVLDLKHLIREKEQDSYLVSYLLDGPEVGDTFNEAWMRLAKLGENFERRKEVLSKLKELDFLPDRILSHYDQKKIKVILDRFKSYFPEYFDLYARTCLSYYQGQGNFENGNPTLNCDKLITLSDRERYVDPFLIQKLKSLPKFKNIH